jgi:DUF2938 family protein/uncharacterized protein DUF6789
MQLHDLLMGITGGIIATVFMDVTNKIFFEVKLINRINVRGIGRVATGWIHGKFIHKSMETVPNVENELLNGVVAHYSIGAVFGVIFTVIAAMLFPHKDLTLYAIVFGSLTTLAAWFAFFPSIGWGMMARKAPSNGKWALTSLVNHVNFGVGLAIGVKIYSLIFQL